MSPTANIAQTSNSVVNLEMSKFKNNVVQKMGGEAQFRFLVISFCDRIKSDRTLKQSYNNVDMKALINLQKDMILASFVDVSPEEFIIIRSRLILRYHLVFREEQFPENHFEALSNNFVAAMRECWIDEDILELCQTYYRAIRTVLSGCAAITGDFKSQQDTYLSQVSTIMSERRLETKTARCA